MNLKIDKINEILVVHKLLNTNQLKSKQTYIERSSFQCISYLRENWPRCEGTLSLCCGTALEETTSWSYAGTSSWLAPNDMSSSLLEELTVIIYLWRAIDFVLCIYINLMYNYIIKFKFDFKKNWQHLSYTGDYPKYSNLQIFKIYAINQLILFYLFQKFWIIQFHLIFNVIIWCF
jgi:hypothetical protein